MEIVISGENRYDDYGNFFFKDKGDKEHKIGTKRKNFDELVNLVVENPDRAVKLTFDSFKKNDYIVGIELLEIQVDESKITEQQKVKQTPQAKPAPSIRENMEWKDKQIDLKFWQGQLGNRIGDGSIDKDFPNMAVKIKGQYYKQMETVTGISMKKED